MKKIAVVIGRFEPIHKGHEKLIDVALKKGDVTLILVIDNSNYILPIRLRINLINEIYKKEINEGKILVKAYKPLDKINYEYGDNVLNYISNLLGNYPNYIVFGSDKKVNNCFREKYLKIIEFIKVERENCNISGTKLRKAIKNKDKYYIKYSFNRKLFKYINKIYKYC